MNAISKAFGCLLFCNVLAILLTLVANDSKPIEYVNLFGCVIFGVWLKTDVL